MAHAAARHEGARYRDAVATSAPAISSTVMPGLARALRNERDEPPNTEGSPVRSMLLEQPKPDRAEDGIDVFTARAGQPTFRSDAWPIPSPVQRR
jgi:hypothetical protein